ncbi:MAG TPA: hypothetical protein VMW29_02500 [Candidatus Bathyarchaeia archaeon]|nr:hypothetical protein [Candidatus Bathyarchaeia archaeon]
MKNLGFYLFFCLVTITCFVILANYKRDTLGDDIHFVWLEGQRLLFGENPYERILLGNMREDNYYAIYFPFFYSFSALTQILGLSEYTKWLVFWRPVSLFFNLGIAFLIFEILLRNKKWLAACFSVLFWLFNRWTLHGTLAAYLDFMPLFFLMLSLIIFKKYQWPSLLIFSFSLAIKQMGIFLIPLYLIWVGQSSQKNAWFQIVIAFLVIFSIPIFISLPFVFWNAEAFFKSIMFSTTRLAATNFGEPSISSIIGLTGIPARIPMFFLLCLIYLAVLRKEIKKYLAVLLTMFTFVYFSPVLFSQHLCWVVCFIPLTLVDKY